MIHFYVRIFDRVFLGLIDYITRREGKIIFDEIISMIRQQELRICNAISLLRKVCHA